MPINFDAHSDRVPNEICTMCGEAKATKVILDPNKFPNNSDKDVWDVCDDCKGFIESTMGDYYRELAQRILTKKGD